jgi:2-iminoacetate synthase ThiH
VTEFHIVGGLHPDLPLEYFLDLVKGLKKRFPKVHIKAFTMVEVAYLARRAKLSIRTDAHQAEGMRALILDARRRRGDLCRPSAVDHLRPQD